MMDAEEVRKPWLTELRPNRPLPPVTSRIEWNPPPLDAPYFLIDRLPGDGDWVDLGVFSSALRAAGLFDNRSLDLPGAIIALPAGQRLARRYCDVVRQHYETAGLVEYDYPCLASMSSLGQFDEVFPSKDKVLLVGTLQDFEQNQPRAVLLPTGEPIIYHHWSKLVRRASDLPVEMYRQTRFFRPWSKSSTGRGIFNSLEGTDMFEFHGCYAPLPAEMAADRLFTMLRTLMETMCVPVVWSTRPPWSNHQEVSQATIGGDTPLPSGASLQVGTFYQQGDIFSRRFGIRYRDDRGQEQTPHHLAGAVSRRLLLAHLLYGMLSNGAFLAHPDLSPDQVHVVISATDLDAAEPALHFVEHLRTFGLRVATTLAPSSGAVSRALRCNPRLHAPLIALLQGRRSSSDSARIIVKRTDDSSEALRLVASFSAIPSDFVTAALADIADSYRSRIHRYSSARVSHSRAIDEVRGQLRDRSVVCAPMRFSSEIVRQVAEWRQGEILGFVQGAEVCPCTISGLACTTSAFISPRA